MNISTLRPVVAAALLGVLYGQANATVFIRPTQTSFTAAPNGTVPVTVELVETGGTSVQDGDGLYSFGFSLILTVGDASISAASRNPAFDKQNTGSTTAFPVSAYQLWADQDANFGTSGPGADGSAVTLATITLNAGGNGGTFTFGDFGMSDQTVLYTGDPLDGTLSYGSFTVTVPEPAALAFVALAAPALIRRRRH